MGRTYKPAKQEHIDYMSKLPEELIISATAAADGRINTARQGINELELLLDSIQTRDKDKDVINPIIEDIRSRTEGLTDNITSDPMNFFKYKPDLMKLQQEVRKQMTTGALSEALKQYQTRGQYEEEMQKILLDSKSPQEQKIMARRLLQEEDESYAGFKTTPRSLASLERPLSYSLNKIDTYVKNFRDSSATNKKIYTDGIMNYQESGSTTGKNVQEMLKGISNSLSLDIDLGGYLGMYKRFISENASLENPVIYNSSTNLYEINDKSPLGPSIRSILLGQSAKTTTSTADTSFNEKYSTIIDNNFKDGIKTIKDEKLIGPTGKTYSWSYALENKLITFVMPNEKDPSTDTKIGSIKINSPYLRIVPKEADKDGFLVDQTIDTKTLNIYKEMHAAWRSDLIGAMEKRNLPQNMYGGTLKYAMGGDIPPVRRDRIISDMEARRKSREAELNPTSSYGGGTDNAGSGSFNAPVTQKQKDVNMKYNPNILADVRHDNTHRSVERIFDEIGTYSNSIKKHEEDGDGDLIDKQRLELKNSYRKLQQLKDNILHTYESLAKKRNKGFDMKEASITFDLYAAQRLGEDFLRDFYAKPANIMEYGVTKKNILKKYPLESDLKPGVSKYAMFTRENAERELEFLESLLSSQAKVPGWSEQLLSSLKIPEGMFYNENGETYYSPLLLETILNLMEKRVVLYEKAYEGKTYFPGAPLIDDLTGGIIKEPLDRSQMEKLYKKEDYKANPAVYREQFLLPFKHTKNEIDERIKRETDITDSYIKDIEYLQNNSTLNTVKIQNTLPLQNVQNTIFQYMNKKDFETGNFLLFDSKTGKLLEGDKMLGNRQNIDMNNLVKSIKEKGLNIADVFEIEDYDFDNNGFNFDMTIDLEKLKGKRIKSSNAPGKIPTTELVKYQNLPERINVAIKGNEVKKSVLNELAKSLERAVKEDKINDKNKIVTLHNMITYPDLIQNIHTAMADLVLTPNVEGFKINKQSGTKYLAGTKEDIDSKFPIFEWINDRKKLFIAIVPAERIEIGDKNFNVYIQDPKNETWVQLKNGEVNSPYFSDTGAMLNAIIERTVPKK